MMQYISPPNLTEYQSMKANTHPDYHEITVVMTDGTEYKTRSTYGKAGDVLRLDVDPKTHPAWNKGGNFVNENAGQIDKFKKRFAGFKPKGSTSGSGDAAASDDKKSDKK